MFTGYVTPKHLKAVDMRGNMFRSKSDFYTSSKTSQTTHDHTQPILTFTQRSLPISIHSDEYE